MADPRGADFLDVVIAIAAHRRDGAPGKLVAAALMPLQRRVASLMLALRPSSKFVLRKLASAVLPGRGRAKRAFLAGTLHLPQLPYTEKEWTKADCVCILTRLLERAPELACIPLDLRERARRCPQCQRGGAQHCPSCAALAT